jgi:serine O-acetyltransferase
VNVRPAQTALLSESLDAGAQGIGRVVEALCVANQGLLRGGMRRLVRRALPSRERIAGVVTDLRGVLFPWHFGAPDVSEHGLAYYVGHTLERALSSLEEQVRVGLLYECPHASEPCLVCAERAIEVIATFASRLPAIRDTLGTDARAAFEGDPAATSPDEPVFCYAGMTAIVHHRIAHELHVLGVPLIPRIIAALAHAATGIDIHPGAQIGESFFIDHGTGVVIGETCMIGRRVRLYQGVTLGAKSFPTDEGGRPIKGIARHPIVEDDVIVYAGATILGRITIGRGSVIGGNVWLTQSVPPGTTASQAQLRHESFERGAGI